MTPTPLPFVRFDDTVEGTTTTPRGFVRTLVAYDVTDVVPVLDEVDAAVRQGYVAAGYVSYEAAAAFADGQRLCAPPRGPTPLAWFAFFDDVITTAAEELDDGGSVAQWLSTCDKATYEERVDAVLRSIARGDVYQANLTTQLRTSERVDVEALYRHLLRQQRPRYGALVRHDNVTIASASPELFFQSDGHQLLVRPMKGTARRGRFSAEDAEVAAQLRTSPKERAENIMIVDLMRNDLGRIAEIGTVRVEELCTVEAYPTVWQMTSSVRCTTRTEVGLSDIFDALFPCGSVTGAPKGRSMELLAGLEGEPRGVYCGAIGLVRPSPDGIAATFSVAIRTAVFDGSGGAGSFGSGGAIVADSSPDSEYREMRLKAGILTPAPPFDLLETFRWNPGGTNEALPMHLARLRHSALRLGFTVPADLEQLLAQELARVSAASRVRLTLSRVGRPTVTVTPAPPARTAPVRLLIDDEPVDSADDRLFHKTTDRALYDDRRSRHREVDDVVLTNERGECTETSIATIVAVLDGQWYTPPLSAGCLPGIGRAVALDKGTVRERTLRPDDLRRADALYVLNSLRGFEAAVLVD